MENVDDIVTKSQAASKKKRKTSRYLLKHCLIRAVSPLGETKRLTILIKPSGTQQPKRNCC